jgi:hypothetical protein
MRVDSFDIDAMADRQKVVQQAGSGIMLSLNAISARQTTSDQTVFYLPKPANVTVNVTQTILRTVPATDAETVYIQPNTEVMGRA